MKSVEWGFFCFIFDTHRMLCCGWTYAMAMAQGISCFSWLIQQGTDQQECCDWGCSHKNSRLVGGFSEDKANRRTEALCHCSGWCLFKFVQGWGGQTCWPCLIVSPINCFCTQASNHDCVCFDMTFIVRVDLVAWSFVLDCIDCWLCSGYQHKWFVWIFVHVTCCLVKLQRQSDYLCIQHVSFCPRLATN